jgi:DsbC/DsbD-like thiol-disulfide interchange protein
MNQPASRIVSLLRLGGASVVFLALAVAIGGAPALGAGGKKTESQVKLTALASKIDADGRQVVTITMDINSGWHAYANPVQFEDLEAAQTTVKISSATKLQEVKVKYPEGKRHTVGKDTYFAYEGKIEITAAIKRAAGDTGPLDVTVKYMTCNKTMCLPPEQVKLQVK